MAVNYSVKIVQSKIMADALKKNLGEVTKLDENFISEFENIKNNVEKLNSE